MYTRLITRIETGCYRLGKDDKFQLFVCLAVHDRLLGKIVTDLTKAVAAQHVSGIYGSGQWGLRQANFLNIFKKLKAKKTRPPKKLKAIFHRKTKCIGNF